VALLKLIIASVLDKYLIQKECFKHCITFALPLGLAAVLVKPYFLIFF